MIIEAASPEGSKAQIYLKDGTLCNLFIARYNTETQEATFYQKDDTGRIKMSDYVQLGTQMVRFPILETKILEGSYAEIDGKRV